VRMVRYAHVWHRMNRNLRAGFVAMLVAGLFAVIGPVAGSAYGATSDPRAGSCATASAVGAPSPKLHQVITVEAPNRTSPVALVSLWSRSGSCFVRVGGPWASSIGRSGLSSHKVEGDGTTPMGEFAISTVMYGIAPNPGVAYQYHRIVCGDWWDEAPSSATYNRFVHVACGATPPFGGDSEALWRVVPQYDYFAVIDYNSSPIVPGRGSAIFIHETIGVPTAGCVALKASALLTLLRWLRPVEHPMIVIAVEANKTR
jgi:L,D-peptidoglycan transpeptidase YkuD (ErfK/YbiS/YcfS/YnhG family)